MSTPKVLIDAQWRPDHFAAPVSPGFKAIPLANRMVPTMPAVSFIVVLAPSMTVKAEGGHPLFLRRSIAQDPTKFTQFIPDEDAKTNPVEGSRQCVHGNTGKIIPLPPNSWPSPPLPGAINCGVIGSDDVKCLNNLEQMIELLANRLYDELAGDPFGFYRNFQKARAASHLAWGKALPGRIVDGVVDAAKGLWTGVKWVGGALWSGVKATGNAIVHPIDTYNAAVEGATDLMESVSNYATAAANGIKTLLDPSKRAAFIEEIKNWLRSQLAGIACPAAEALQEMMMSKEPLASQFGKLSAAIEQNVAEVAGQVAVTVLGDKGISKLAMLSKAGKLGGLSEDLSQVMGRLGRRAEGANPSPKMPSPTDKKPDVPSTPEGKPSTAKVTDDQKHSTEKPAGGAQGNTGVIGCLFGCNVDGHPVNAAYGSKVLFGFDDLDFDLPAVMPMPWQRFYVSQFAGTGWLGQGWLTPYSTQILRSGTGLILVDEQGREIHLPEPKLGEPYRSRFEQLVIEATPEGGFAVSNEGGDVRYVYAALGPSDDAEAQAKQAWPLHTLRAIEDRNGNRIQLVYGEKPQELRELNAFEPEEAAALVTPIGLIDSAGRHLRLDFESLGSPLEPKPKGMQRGLRLSRIVQITDVTPPGQPAQRLDTPRTLVSYAYSDAGDLIEVRNMLGQVTREFRWDNHMLVEHRNAGGIVSQYAYTELSPQGKVLRNWSNDGRSWTFDYQPGYTDVTFRTLDDPKGRIKRWLHDEAKNYTGHVDEMGGAQRRELDAFGNLTSITDEADRTTRYTLNTSGQPVELVAPDGATTRIAYHPTLGKVAELVDPTGATTTYQYDQRGNLVETVDALGHRTRFDNNERGLPIAIHDALGRTKYLSYNAAGQLTQYVDCSGQKTQYSYDAWGHVSQITNALGDYTQYEHNAAGHLLSIRHPDGATETFEYDTAGRLIAYSDPLGARTRYELALDGLPLARTNAEGGALRYEYDGARRLKALINENQARYDFTYDALNRLVEETGFDARNTRYRYDPTGLLLAKLEAGTLTGQERLARTQPAADSTSPIIPPQRTAPTLDDPWGLGMLDDTAPPQAPPGHAITTRYERDAGGRLVRKQVAGNVLQADGTLSSQHKSTTYRYDPAGRLTEATNAQGAKTTLSYDAIGQLVSEARTGQGLHSQLLHQYDALGNRTQTTLPDGRTLNWLYYGSGHLHQINLDGEVISDIERDALHRETFRSQGALQSRYQYDALGRLSAQATWRIAMRNTSSMTSTPTERPGAWAALGDETHMNSARPAQGAAILGRRYQYDLAGNLQGINDLHHGTTQYQYDKIGRLLSAMQPRLNERFAFDPAHNMVPPDGSSKERTPGLIKNNRLEVFEDKRFTYDTHGNLIEKRIGKHTIIQLSWDVEHQLQSAKVIKAAHTRQPVITDTSYRYDAFGRRLEKKSLFASTLFEWDGNRLLAEHRGSEQTLYVYEADSFAPLAQVCSVRTTRDALDAPPSTRHAIALTAHETDTDDPVDGWQPRKSAQAFEAQIRALQKATLDKVNDPAKAAANDDTVSAEAATDELPSNVVGLTSWRIRYYHNDHLGTPRELSSDSGEILWSATYKAWGNTLQVAHQEYQTQVASRVHAQTAPIEQNLRFQGQYFDTETGLHYNRFRYYDPDVGRFISQDPIGLAGGTTLYMYTINPSVYIDPLGLVDIKHFDASEAICGYADKVPNDPKRLSVGGHGTPLVDCDGSTISIQELADQIRAHPKYKKGMPVDLFSCNTGAGKNSYGQALANELGVSVKAPDNLLWYYSNGKLVPAPYNRAGDGPDLKNQGTMRRFKPQKRHRRMSKCP